MATKIYLSGGAINIDDGTTLSIINPSKFDWKLLGSEYIARDDIDRQSVSLGDAANIQDENGIDIGNDIAVKELLNSFVNTPSTNQIDNATNAVMTIDYSHHEIHSGSHFFHFENNLLGSGAVRDLLIITPDTARWAHFTHYHRSTGEANFALYENTVTSADGTALIGQNRNRNVVDASIVAISHTPTITDVGDLICVGHFGSGNNKGAEARSEAEIVLKQNTKYLLRINSEVNSNDITTNLDWYEHTNK